MSNVQKKRKISVSRYPLYYMGKALLALTECWSNYQSVLSQSRCVYDYEYYCVFLHVCPI